MKALSIQPFYATMIAIGAKFIELRTWKTDYRGWLLTWWKDNGYIENLDMLKTEEE